jgi:uncharacterized protein (TIGR03000 family)
LPGLAGKLSGDFVFLTHGNMGGSTHMTLKKSCFVALIAGCALAMSANTSFAFFGHHRGGSCGSWGGGWGSHGGSWGGSYGGGWGSGGSYGGSWGGGSCGSHGGGYAYYGGYYDGGYASSRVIYRGFASSAPSTTVVEQSAPAVKTSLTIKVPADAKISLAGVDTKQSGEVRQFATTRLAAGQTWDGYKVVVELNKNGQTLHEERTIKLVGGESQELSINFDSNVVAKN